jgi:hypothetical protein
MAGKNKYFWKISLLCFYKQTYLLITSLRSLLCSFNKQPGFIWGDGNVKMHHWTWQSQESCECICSSCDFTKEALQKPLDRAFLYEMKFWSKKQFQVKPSKSYIVSKIQFYSEKKFWLVSGVALFLRYGSLVSHPALLWFGNQEPYPYKWSK